MKFMVDKILSHEFNNQYKKSATKQISLGRSGSAQRGSRYSRATASHVVDDMELMIDNFYSRYTSMTGEEAPIKNKPNFKATTMIKNPNDITAEHSKN